MTDQSVHGGSRLTLQERDHVNETAVSRFALPWLDDDGVLGLQRGVLGISVEKNDLGQVSVQVGQVLPLSARLTAELDATHTLTTLPSAYRVDSRNSL